MEADPVSPIHPSENLFDNPEYTQIVGDRPRSPADVKLFKSHSDDDIENDLNHRVYELNILIIEARRRILKYGPKVEDNAHLAPPSEGFGGEKLVSKQRSEDIALQLEALRLEKEGLEKSLADEISRRAATKAELSFSKYQFEHCLKWHGVGMKIMYDFATMVAEHDPEKLLP